MVTGLTVDLGDWELLAAIDAQPKVTDCVEDAKREVMFYEGADSEIDVYAREEGKDQLYKVLGNLAVAQALHLLYTKQRDVRPLVPKPRCVGHSPWTIAYFRHYYGIAADPKLTPRTRYREISVQHPGDKEVVSTYRETVTGDDWLQAPVEHRDDVEFRTEVANKYDFYVKKRDSDVLYFKDSTALDEYWNPADRWYELRAGTIERQDHYKASLAAFYKTPPNQSWIWVKLNVDISEALAAGGHEDDLGILICVDRAWTIRNRVVVKALSRNHMDLDNDPKELSGEPRELFIHRKLTRHFPEKRNFVKYITHSYHHSSNHKRYKMYLEWAPYKTLNSVLNKHVADTRTNCSYLPETFIWCVFKRLVYACSQMQDSISLGRTYIHTDIKPANILFDTASTTSFPAYKTPILADFGHYYLLSYDFIENPNFAAPGFWAPEHFGEPPQSPAKVNVFQIGLLVWSMMRNTSTGVMTAEDFDPRFPRLDPEFHRGKYADITAYLKHRDTELSHDYLYSNRLEKLVEKCLEPDIKSVYVGSLGGLGSRRGTLISGRNGGYKLPVDDTWRRIANEDLKKKVKIGLDMWDNNNGRLERMRVEDVPSI